MPLNPDDTMNPIFQVVKNKLIGKALLLNLVMFMCTLEASQRVDSLDRHRVIVSTDIGGTDPDDFQSLVHLLLYSDILDIEGIISSPYGEGRKKDILQVIDYYQEDFKNLKSYSENYPTPDFLRAISKQGELKRAPHHGYRSSTEGSNWIIYSARMVDSRPLHILVWGGLEDLAQALHDAPDILPKLRVYWIGGPNKKWSPDAYQYIVENHKNLWIIETNSTYRGWFNGGDQSGEFSNKTFVSMHVDKHGKLGTFFSSQLGGTIKMGDTPSVAWLLKGNPDKPGQPGWGGQFVKAWNRPFLQLNKMPSSKDKMEIFGILELSIPIQEEISVHDRAYLMVDNQSLEGFFSGDKSIKFRFSPKSAKTFKFKIESNLDSINGLSGGISASYPTESMTKSPTNDLPNWWADSPSSEFFIGPHMGAKTVSQWRSEFLGDFRERMDRCLSPKKKKTLTQ